MLDVSIASILKSRARWLWRHGLRREGAALHFAGALFAGYPLHTFGLQRTALRHEQRLYFREL
jgi:hypothetical protein